MAPSCSNDWGCDFQDRCRADPDRDRARDSDRKETRSDQQPYGVPDVIHARLPGSSRLRDSTFIVTSPARSTPLAHAVEKAMASTRPR